jgi:APA family basic amino acid/polyamine antiporter
MTSFSSLMRRTPAELLDGAFDAPKHLNWVMLTALGIGATIGAGIFAMPGIIARKAGPAGILSFVITGLVIASSNTVAPLIVMSTTRSVN